MSRGGSDPLHGTARHALFYAKRALVILIIRFFKRKSIYRVHVLKGDAYLAVLRVLDKGFLTQSSAVNLAWSPGRVTPYPRMRMKGLSGIHNR